jgi:hypothetical protein
MNPIQQRVQAYISRIGFRRKPQSSQWRCAVLRLAEGVRVGDERKVVSAEGGKRGMAGRGSERTNGTDGTDGRKRVNGRWERTGWTKWRGWTEWMRWRRCIV